MEQKTLKIAAASCTKLVEKTVATYTIIWHTTITDNDLYMLSNALRLYVAALICPEQQDWHNLHSQDSANDHIINV